MVIAREYYIVSMYCSDNAGSHLEKAIAFKLSEHSVRTETEIIRMTFEIQPTTGLLQMHSL